MDDFIQKITPEGISRIEPEKDKLPPDKAPQQQVNESIRWLILHLQILQKILQLSPKEMSEDTSLLQRKYLKKFYSSLKELTEQDLSHDTVFLLQLSRHWNHFLEYFSPLNIPREEEKNLQEFFSEMHSYPANERYSLGYYLSGAAGESWIPFPYMTLLHDLYENHQKEKDHSTLAHWISLLEHYLGKEI